MIQHVKAGVDAGSAVAAVAAIFHSAPNIAASLAALWYIGRFIEWTASKLKRKGN